MQGLTLVRMVAGVAVLAKLVDLVPMLLALTDPTRMRAPVVGVIPYPTTPAVWIGAAAALVAAVLLIAGVADRVAAGTLAGGVGVVLALDAQLYANHLYLLWLVLLVWAIAPADARPASYRWLVTIVYGFAAIAKLNASYLSGTVLGAYLGSGLLSFPEALRVWWVLAGLAVLSVIVEALVAAGLWVRRWRREAVVAGVALHATIVFLVAPWTELAVFAGIMVSLYTAFATSPATSVDGAARQLPTLGRAVRFDAAIWHVRLRSSTAG